MPSLPNATQFAFRFLAASIVTLSLTAKVRCEEAAHKSSEAPRKSKEGKQLAGWRELRVEDRALLRGAYSRPRSEWPKPTLDRSVALDDLGPLPKPEHPKSNPPTAEKQKLGEKLYFDKRLSADGKTSCATCHAPERGWANGHASLKENPLWKMRRDPLPLQNVGLLKTFGWDGVASTLEDYIQISLTSPAEMDIDESVARIRLNDDKALRALFTSAFGDDQINFDRIKKALAVYLRTINGDESAFDKFVGGDKDALSDEAIYGLHIFRTDARCLNCHNGPNFTDQNYHEVGLSYYGRELEDLGRYYVTNDDKDASKFRTPSLRNLTQTGPYSHKGTFQLEGMLNLVNAGMPNIKPRNESEENDPRFPKKSPLIKKLDLSGVELGYLRVFLESLAEPQAKKSPVKKNP